MFKKIINNSLISKNIKLLLLISLIFFLIKWGTSFYFITEDLAAKIIFESVSDGSFFYPLIKFLSNLEFNNSLNPMISNLNTVPMPFGSILIHTFFYKIFGLSGLIIVDFFGIFLFFLIFFNIFLFFNTKYNSIFFTLMLFSMPLIFEVFLSKYVNTPPISQFRDFFTLRVHRPFPASLYFFSVIFLVIKMNYHLIFKKRYFILIGVLLGLSLSSFYYFFIIEVIFLSLFFIYKFKSKILEKLLQNYKCILVLLLSFFIVSLPFIINLFYTENDVLVSAALTEITNEKKIYLLKYYLSKVFELKFIFLNFFLLSLIIFIRKLKIKNLQIADIFYLIYLSTLLAPFIFIIFTTKVSLLHHFNNSIVMYASLSFLISSIIIFQKKFNFNLNLFIILLVILSIFSIQLIQKISNYKEIDTKRYEFNEVVKIIKLNQKKINLDTLLTFNTEFMTWGILNDKIKYLNLTMIGMTPKNHDLQEKDLINVFKFLNLDSKDFITFKENKKQGWRYLNYYTATFFLHKYTANSLFTFNDSKNFSDEINKFILNSSPLYHQQIIIPEEEFIRLENKFSLHKDNNMPKPDIIIFSNDLSFVKKSEINLFNYCKVFNGKIYKMFISNKSGC